MIQKLDINNLVDIYLDGFATGISTLALNITGNEAEADRVADEITQRLIGDPAAMETLRQEIYDRFTGVNNGPHNLRVFDMEGK